MSLQHTGVRAFVALTGRGRTWRSTDAFRRALERRDPWPATPPSSPRGVVVSQRDEPEGRVVRLVPRAASGSVVALHGGAYVFGPEPQHWAFWRRIAVASRREVVVPLYRLAPEGTAAPTVPWVADVVRRQGERTALLGDSAGGGLALAAALRLRDEGLRPPLLLVSPWLDATMRQPWTLQRDPWLAAEGLARAAALWAGDLPVDDPMLSPLLADLAGIGPVVVASGTRDVLHEDARRLRQLAPGPVRLLVGEGLLHDYPLLPVPEARPAIRAFVDALR